AMAISLETVSMQLAKMVGPVLAGVGLAHSGPAACFGVLVMLYATGLAVSLGLGRRIDSVKRRAGASGTASFGAAGRGARCGRPGRNPPCAPCSSSPCS